MKQIKFSLMLALLCVGVGSAWAQTYTAVPSDYWEDRGGGVTFTDGTLIFSTRKRTEYSGDPETRGDGKFSYGNMASGEVCVGLLLDTQEEVTDIWRAPSKNGTFSDNGGAMTVGTKIYGDADNNDEGTVYSYIGRSYTISNNAASYNRPMYERTRTINLSHAANVTIPATVTYNDVEYKVTEVDFGGFIYLQNSCNPVELCTKTSKTDGTYEMTEGSYKYYGFICVGHNDYLQNVTFLGDNLKKIGKFAFAGCDKLASVTIPYNVENVEEDAFYMCKNLRTVNFQVNASTRKSNLTTIGNFAFAHLYQLSSVVLPEGLETMGTYGFAYNTSLQSITLPSTMTTAGAHFLCNCSSLPKLTIPANLTNLDGAFLHGCENLKELYMLGYPQNLTLTSGNYNAWEGNHADCTGHVNDINVYYASNVEEDLKGNQAWQTLLFSDVAKAWGINAQSLMVVTRDFTADKWVTACFPKGVSASDLSTTFGLGTKAAKFARAVRLPDEKDPKTGKNLFMYNLIFELQDYSTNGIPKDLPLMFCPANTVNNYAMWTVTDVDDDFIKGWTKDHNEKTTINAENEDGGNDDFVSQVSMKSNYVSRPLQPWDFYFSYNGGDSEAKFYRVYKLNDTSAGPTRCWWTVSVNGVVSSDSGAKTNTMFFDDVDGIGGMDAAPVQIAIKGVYDTQGRRLDIPAEELPHGLFIVNGQKVFIK